MPCGLADDAVEWIDAEVSDGRAASRADLIGRLVAREARRRRALTDIETMRRAGVSGYPELDGMAEAAARLPIDLD